MENEIIKTEEIKNLIYTIRGKQVMLDSDVAMLYQYETKRINETVRRNIERFPKKFCFQLTDDEFNILRSQIATLENYGRGKHKKYLPYAFTEQGIAMLSGVLKNEIAVQVSIKIIDAFVEMRKFLIDKGFKVTCIDKEKYKPSLKLTNSIQEYSGEIEIVC